MEFCKRLKTAEEIYQTQGEVNHPPPPKNKQSSERHQPAKLVQSKGSKQAANPSEEDANKNKTKNKDSPVCPLHGLGHDMNSCKAILEQAKAMNLTWSTACSGGVVRVRFQGAKKRPDEVEELNALVAKAVKAVLTTNKHKKPKASSDSGSEDDQEKFNFETFKIGEE